MTTGMARFGAAALLGAFLLPAPVSAQPLPPLSVCNSEPKAPFCSAVRGDRSEGWRSQSRAEVMAQHGMVTTSQPLAAQAGLRILMQGGNAIDAAVAAAAMLNIVEPMNVGIGGDLFAIIYIAKENKIYVLNASGMAPTGATVEHFNALGYRWDPKNWGPGSGMPSYGILPVTVPGTVWGWDAVLKRFGKKTFKDVLEPAIDYAENGFPVSERIANDWRLPPALPLRNCCTRTRSGFGEDLVHQRQAARCRPDLPQSRSRQDLPAHPEERRRTASTRAKWRARWSRNRPRSAAP